MEKMDESEMLMDHCAMECMHAIKNGDKESFMDSLHVLVADLLNKMGTDDKGDK